MEIINITDSLRLKISPAISGTEKTKRKKMIEKILSSKNIRSACKQVMSNQGSSGVDGMSVTSLPHYVKENLKRITTAILEDSYAPQSILGVEIPKRNGKTRLLGIPTVVDRL